MDGPSDRSRRRGQSTAVVVVALVLLVFVLGVGAVVVANMGGDGGAGGAPAASDRPGALTARWVSDTGRDIQGNHHVAIGGRVGGEPLVFAPISGHAEAGGHDHGHDHSGGGDDHHHASTGCALVALGGESGNVLWSDRVPPANCTIHSVADPTLADANADDRPEVIAATTTKVVAGYNPMNGTVEFRHNLTAYGYSRPLVRDIIGDDRQELIVVDVHGDVFVIAQNGTVVWQRSLPADYVWAQPHADDFDGDGDAELLVALGDGTLYLLDGNGSTVWTRPVERERGGISWLTTGQADDDPAAEFAAAGADGFVTVFDGDDGSLLWKRDYGAYSAVHAFGDGDGDGTAELYATARDGRLRAATATTGDTEWTTNVTTSGVQMMPPPVLGDLDGDGSQELVAATNNGRVTVVDPATGTITATYARDVPIWTNPTLADLDADGAMEVVVMYGDGRVALLSYTEK